MSGNRSKKNGKKNKFGNTSEVLQVKSVKLETNRSSNRDAKPNAKSEDNLRKGRRFNILKNPLNYESVTMSNEGGVVELETCLAKKFKSLSLGNDGENNVPSTSTFKTSTEKSCSDVKKTDSTADDELPLVMQYCPEFVNENEAQVEDFAGTYKYYTKNTKSIKFTNQVTVLYFNGEDILCESMEPLKKEQDQQLRNKEMRKEHLMSKGPIDNLYLF